jgi:protein-L-isoaspartate(D-aspartate) O-methyltransferase
VSSTASEPARQRSTSPSAARVAVPSVSLACDPSDLVDLLDLRQGHRLLEINALDAAGSVTFRARVGCSGEVVTLPASKLGSAPAVRYDRLVAWSAPSALPSQWIEHVAPNGVAVLPVLLAPLAVAEAVARVSLDAEGQPDVTGLVPTRLFAHRSRSEPPERFVDSAMLRPDGHWWWISAEWLHGRDHGVATDLLDLLARRQRRRPSPVASVCDHTDLVGYLLATRPDGVLTAGLGGSPAGIGCALPGSVAVLAGESLVLGGTAEALDGLLDWIAEWRAEGRPGLADLWPRLVPRRGAWELEFGRPEIPTQ